MESKKLTNELIDMFDSSPEMPSASVLYSNEVKLNQMHLKLFLKVSPQNHY